MAALVPLGSIRPRFSLEIPGSAEEGIARVVAGFSGPDSRGRSRVLGRHLDIAMNQAERRYWSPVVQLEFEERDGKTVVHGLIGVLSPVFFIGTVWLAAITSATR